MIKKLYVLIVFMMFLQVIAEEKRIVDWEAFAKEQNKVPEKIEKINLWSGKEQILPFVGNWQLVADHGRILAQGNDKVIINIPALEKGTSINANLIVDNKKTAQITIYSPVLLSKYCALTNSLTKQKQEILKGYGTHPVCTISKLPILLFTTTYDPNEKNNLTFILPEKNQFPISIPEKWDEISIIIRSKNKGILSVLLDKELNEIDIKGEATCVKFQGNGKTVYVFTPDFDLEDIDNVLLIKKLAENYK